MILLTEVGTGVLDLSLLLELIITLPYHNVGMLEYMLLVVLVMVEQFIVEQQIPNIMELISQ